MPRIAAAVLIVLVAQDLGAATVKPVLHGRHWVAITGKPLAATAGAMMFQKGGNAVDAACAMLAATSTMWDTLGWGGETQALVYNPKTGKVVGGQRPRRGPHRRHAGVLPGQGHGLPARVRAPLRGHAGHAGRAHRRCSRSGASSASRTCSRPRSRWPTATPSSSSSSTAIERHKARLKEWPYSKAVFLTHPGETREAAAGGRGLQAAGPRGHAAQARGGGAAGPEGGEDPQGRPSSPPTTASTRATSPRSWCAGTKEQGGLITLEDLANWKWHLEEPVMTTYKGIEVYKLNTWVQGPALLQALNILENVDLKAMGYNSARYIHTVYQAMNMAFADRDFYYGDPYFPPEEPIKGLLSKDYAKQRVAADARGPERPRRPSGRSLSVPGRHEPVHRPPREVADGRRPEARGQAERAHASRSRSPRAPRPIEAADAEGWVVSITPSGAWMPAVIAGRTGIGLSQRMQSFVLDEAENPFNVLAPGKRPRATLTPSLALKDGKPFLSFAVQGGDTQEQNLLQFFLNVVEFGMNVQEACEAPNVTSYQMRNSFGSHESQPGRLTAERGHARRGCARSWRAWATSSSTSGSPPAPSTRSSSTASTARSGAAPATTARTTGSPGESCGSLRAMPKATRRDFLGVSAGTAAAFALPRLTEAQAKPEAKGPDALAAVRAEVQKRHDEGVARLQQWVKQPSIAAENRGMDEGCELMMKLAREAGFQTVTTVPTTDGQPSVFATLDAGAPRTRRRSTSCTTSSRSTPQSGRRLPSTPRSSTSRASARSSWDGEP